MAQELKVKKKTKLVFVFPNVLGGVASFNYNLITAEVNYKLSFEIEVVLLNDTKKKSIPAPYSFEPYKTTYFRYSSAENQYYAVKRLKKFLPKDDGIIVCDHSLVLTCISIFKLKSKIVHLLHDYFYVNQNFKFPNTIDFSIAHSSFFRDCLISCDFKFFNDKSVFIPYGVKQLILNNKVRNEVLELVFLGRLTEMKGVHNLIKVENELMNKNVQVNWTIIGNGDLEFEIHGQWNNKKNVRFIKPDTQIELYGELATKDILVFPTLFEGTPVSIFECMSNGVVTIVNDLPGGIRDHVKSDLGFLVENDPKAFAEIIEMLNSDRSKLEYLQLNNLRYAKKHLDIETNMGSYYKQFEEVLNMYIASKKFDKPILNRLDKSFLPNFIVKFLRKSVI